MNFTVDIAKTAIMLDLIPGILKKYDGIAVRVARGLMDMQAGGTFVH